MSDFHTRWLRFQGHALFAYFRLVTRTAHFQVEGWPNVQKVKESGRPRIWTSWHGMGMGFMHFGDKFLDARNFMAIVVGDDRSNVLDVLGRSIGGQPIAVDMQGNPVAAGRAVLKVVRSLKAGMESVLFPDGPDGPAFVPKAGIAFLARKARAAILPIGVWTKWGHQMNRWDRYLVAYPFARLHVTIGEPLFIDEGMPEEDVLARVIEANNAVRTRAQILAGVTSPA
ncbi:MAG: hypothetical protein KA314_00105 [Chloroflexi bacterium]|nr:hypothetical protein [Chloroflexota bacterium]MBP8054209.1 hypothetical protein [Chloroflexota bacterium]